MSQYGSPASFAPGLVGWTPTRRRAGLVAWLRRTVRVAATRRHLAGMDDRMLADIGVSRSDAHAEASRRFWDHRPPDFWR